MFSVNIFQNSTFALKKSLKIVFKALRAEILRNILIAKELENEKEEKLDIPAEAPVTSQTTNANKTTPNKKSKKRKHKVQKPKHQKW